MICLRFVQFLFVMHNCVFLCFNQLVFKRFFCVLSNTVLFRIVGRFDLYHPIFLRFVKFLFFWHICAFYFFVHLQDCVEVWPLPSGFLSYISCYAQLCLYDLKNWSTLSSWYAQGFTVFCPIQCSSGLCGGRPLPSGISVFCTILFLCSNVFFMFSVCFHEDFLYVVQLVVAQMPQLREPGQSPPSLFVGGKVVGVG